MKERLHDLGIKTTELSTYMKISRPSLYKYIGAYEEGETTGIPTKVLNTFRYIDRHKSLTKEKVISFVILEFADEQTTSKKEAIKNYLLSKSNNDAKISLMYQLIATDALDDIVQYLTNASIILSSEKEDMSDEDIYMVVRLVNLKHDIITNYPLTDDELNKAKEILGEFT
ncbi:MAG: hypothetical protein IKP04_05415 [Candidatus Methanomethylophilaceae archaeon]|nr:hypothetical protein [Candidatus Methanomethylophilaceae archaeon]